MVWLASITTPVALTVAKFVAFTSRVYVPGGTSGKRYEPSPPVVVDCEKFVPTFVIVTVALGTTAPVGSVTVPVMTPCTDCDQTAPPLARISSAATNTAKVRNFMLSPLSKAFSAKASEIDSNFRLSRKKALTTTLFARTPRETAPLTAIQVLFPRNVKCKLELEARRTLCESDCNTDKTQILSSKTYITTSRETRISTCPRRVRHCDNFGW